VSEQLTTIHSTRPVTDPKAERMQQETTSDGFRDTQARLLKAYSAQAASHVVGLSEPALRTHYPESGHGDAVLMIHGGNSFAASWAPLIQPLSETQSRL
jgi:hypothetical protein